MFLSKGISSQPKTNKMNELKQTGFSDFEGTGYDGPAFGEGPMDGFVVCAEEADGENIVHIQAFFAADNERQAKYRVTYLEREKAERIIAYELGGTGWIEEGCGATPFAKAIGRFIAERFSGANTR